MNVPHAAWEVPDTALKTARAVARRVARSHRQIVPEDELLSVCYEWIASHRRQTLQWSMSDEDRNALYTSMLRAAQQYVLNERTRHGNLVSDHFFYNAGIVETVLPDVWDVESWGTSRGEAADQEKRSTSSPSEGGGRMAALADVSKAMRVLTADEEATLRLKYHDGYNLTEIANQQNVSTEAVRKRVNRALSKLIDALGGEAPWELDKRRKQSNARAQARVRTQYDGGRSWNG